MAPHPDRRCKHYIRLADIPTPIRIQAASTAKLEWPGDGAELLAAALYPDPDHGEWIAIPPEQILRAAA